MAIKNFLTPTEAAAYIGCTDSRVRQMLREGLIVGEKVSERLWLVPIKEAERIRVHPAETGRPRKLKKQS